jgi:hypothetical protein
MSVCAFGSVSEFIETLRACIKEELKLAREAELAEKLVPPKQACVMLNITIPTLNAWVGKGWLKKHYLGSRVYYKHGEITSALGRIKRSTR